MSDISLKLLNLINEEYTLNEITSLLGLSNDEIYKIFRDLKDIGINFNRSYYYSGDIVYLPKKELDLSSKKNCINLITKPEEEVFRAMVISDLHAGSIYESKDAWYKIYDYCIVNNIHNIIIITHIFNSNIDIRINFIINFIVIIITQYKYFLF